MERRLAAIISADLEGYSRMMAEDETSALITIRALREQFFEPLILEHGGEILKRMGDGWLVSFASVVGAVDCAMDVQRNLADHDSIRLRIGVHLGDIVVESGDVYGDGINIAARLQGQAPSGGILLSDDVHRMLSGKTSESFSSAGPLRLKNISRQINGFVWTPTGPSAKGGMAQAKNGLPVILVEPFICTTGDDEETALADEIRETLVFRLSRRSGIRLIARQVAAGGSSPVDPDYLLHGRVRKISDRVRTNIALTWRRTGEEVWVDRFEADAGALLDLMDDIADRADAGLRVQINAFDARRLGAADPEALDVQGLLTLAASHFYGLTIDHYRTAVSLIDRAISKAPDNAMALAMRVDGGATLAAAMPQDLHDEDDAALRAKADHAVELDQSSDYAFFARGVLRVLRLGDPHGALADAEQSLKISPAYTLGMAMKGVALICLGRAEEAVSPLEKAIELSATDPYVAFHQYHLALARLFSGDSEGAETSIRKALQLQPNIGAFHSFLAVVLDVMGDKAGAERARGEAARVGFAPHIFILSLPLPGAYARILDTGLAEA